MTYMYNGTVSVPHNKLQTFLKTAEALKIKGIVDTGTSDDSAVSDTSVSPLVSPGPGPLLPPQVQELLGMSHSAHAHPAGDLSLLASAAIEQGSAALDPAPPGNTQHNNKRRKTAPRKLGSYLLNNSSHINRAQNNATMSVNGSDEENGGHSDRDTEKENNRVVMSNGSIRNAFTNGKLSARNLAKPDITSNTFKTEKSDESLDLTVKSMLSQSEDSPQSPSPPTSSSHLSLLSSSLLPVSGASPLNLLVSRTIFLNTTFSLNISCLRVWTGPVLLTRWPLCWARIRWRLCLGPPGSQDSLACVSTVRGCSATNSISNRYTNAPRARLSVDMNH